MQQLRQINRNTVEINGLVGSRENFRIQHLGAEQELFDQGIEGYTGILMEMLRDLKCRIEGALEELAPHLDSRWFARSRGR